MFFIPFDYCIFPVITKNLAMIVPILFMPPGIVENRMFSTIQNIFYPNKYSI